MATYTSNYGWTKPSGSDNVDISVLNDNLDDQDSTIHDAFLNMAPPFSESSTYAVDDIVLYGTGLYKCHTAVVTPGSWTGSTNWQVHKLSEGGGGTTDYDDLENHPSINNVELSGNKTGAQLGLQNTLTFDNVPTDGSNNPVKSGGVYASDEAIRQWTTAEAKSVSGNPITLTDGSERKAEGLVVDCEPMQNLHGYEKPWAGGAGKNKLPMTVDGIKALNTSGTWSGNKYIHSSGMTVDILTDTDDNVIGFDFSGTASKDSIYFPFALNVSISNGSYILNTPTASGKTGMWLTMSRPNKAIPLENNTSNTVTVDNGLIGSVHIYFEQNTTLNHYIIRPMIRLASVSDATFAPYSNECPITGLTECVVDDHSFNLWDEALEEGTISGATGQNAADPTYRRSKNYIPLDGESYYFYISDTAANSKSVFFLYYDANKNYIGTSAQNPKNGNVFQPNVNGAKYTRFCLLATAVENKNICFNISNTAKNGTYEPYQAPTSATITFGQTVYGGSVDFKSGKVRVTHAIADLGNLEWRYDNGTARFYTTSPLSGALAPSGEVVPNALCSVYKVVKASGQGGVDYSIAISASGAAWVKDITYGTDYTAFKTAITGQTLCYELATPTELTLTPAELELLKGYNYISTNGTTIALDYLPDSLLAEVENYVDAKIPPAPSSDGTYVLTCTVTSGTPAYSWESAT